MFPPSVVVLGSPGPGVGMDDHVEFRLVDVLLVHMPADVVAVAHDLGRGAGGRGEDADRRGGADHGLGQITHWISPCRLEVVAAPEAPIWAPRASRKRHHAAVGSPRPSL